MDKLLDFGNATNSQGIFRIKSSASMARPSARTGGSSHHHNSKLNEVISTVDAHVAEILELSDKNSGTVRRPPLLISKYYNLVKILAVNKYAESLYLMIVRNLELFFDANVTIREYLDNIIDMSRNIVNSEQLPSNSSNQNDDTSTTNSSSVDVNQLFNNFTQEDFDQCCQILYTFIKLFNYVFAKINPIDSIFAYFDRNVLVNSYSKLTVRELANSLFYKKLFVPAQNASKFQTVGRIVLVNVLKLLHFNRLYQLNRYLVEHGFDPVLPNEIIVKKHHSQTASSERKADQDDDIVLDDGILDDNENNDGSSDNNGRNEIDPEKLLLNTLLIFKKIDLIMSNIGFYRYSGLDVVSLKSINFNRVYLNELNRFCWFLTQTPLLEENHAVTSSFMAIFERIFRHETILANLIFNNRFNKQEVFASSHDSNNNNNSNNNSNCDDFYFKYLNQYHQYSIFAVHSNFQLDNNKRFIYLIRRILLYKLIINNDYLNKIFIKLFSDMDFVGLKKLYEFHQDFDLGNTRLDDEVLKIHGDTLAELDAEVAGTIKEKEQENYNEKDGDVDEDYDEDEDVNDDVNDYVNDRFKKANNDTDKNSSTNDTRKPSVDSLALIWFNTIYNQLFTSLINFKKKNLKNKEKDKDLASQIENSIIELLYRLKDKYLQFIENSFDSNPLFVSKVNKSFIKIININNNELIIELVKYCDLFINSLFNEYINDAKVPIPENKPFVTIINEVYDTKLAPKFEIIYWFFKKFYQKRFEFFIHHYRQHLSKRLLNINNIINSEHLNKKIFIENLMLVLFTKDFIKYKHRDNQFIAYLETEFNPYKGTRTKLKPEIYKSHQSSINDNSNSHRLDDAEEVDADFDSEELVAKFHSVYSMIKDIDISQKFKEDFMVYQQKKIQSTAQPPKQTRLFLSPFAKEGDTAQQVEFDPLIFNTKLWPNFSNNNFDLMFPKYEMPQLFDSFNDMFFEGGPSSSKLYPLLQGALPTAPSALPSSTLPSASSLSSSWTPDQNSKYYINNSHKILNWNYYLHYLVLDFNVNPDNEDTPKQIHTAFIVGCVLLLFNETDEWSYVDILQRLKPSKNLASAPASSSSSSNSASAGSTASSSGAGGGKSIIGGSNGTSSNSGTGNKNVRIVSQRNTLTASSRTLSAMQLSKEALNDVFYNNNMVNKSRIVERMERKRLLGEEEYRKAFDSSSSKGITEEDWNCNDNENTRDAGNGSVVKEEDEEEEKGSKRQTATPKTLNHDPDDIIKRAIFSLQKSGILINKSTTSTLGAPTASAGSGSAPLSAVSAITESTTVSGGSNSNSSGGGAGGRFSKDDVFIVNEQFNSKKQIVKIPLVSSKAIRKLHMNF